MFFVPGDGNIYCKACFNSNNFGGIKIDIVVLTALRHSIYSEFKNIFSFELSGDGKKLFSDVAQLYTCSKLERSFKSLEFYNQIKLS